MQAPERLEDPLEREWRTLARKLRLARSFCFIVYFVADQRSSAFLKNRLRAASEAEGKAFVEVAVDDPGRLVSETLSTIFDAAADPSFVASASICWVEAFRNSGDPLWTQERTRLLMRMNERRSRLEAEVGCPLILLLPAGAQRDVGMLAPDLWHIRLHSTSLAAEPAPWVHEGARSRPNHADRWAVEDAASPAMAPSTGTPEPGEIAFWRSMMEQSTAEPVADPSFDGVSLWDGFAAVDAALTHGLASVALEIAHQVLQLARGRIAQAARQAKSASPEQLRELSVALTSVGDAERMSSRGEAALAAYRESLDICRTLCRTLGGSAQALRDLSVSLDKVGDAERDAGRGEAALAAYRESLEIRRTLRRILDDSAQVLRDLSVSLDKVGDAERDAGRGEAALTAYRESLEIRRTLRRTLGDSAQVLRDLLVSCIKVGDAERDAGRGETALAAYRESLDICRTLRRTLGDSAQVLRDLSVSLDRVGDAERDADRNETALAAYRESLDICRALRRTLGGSAQVLRDLSVSLEKVGDAERDAGRGEAALAAYRESLEIRRTLRRMLGDGLRVLDDLATSLERCASLAEVDPIERSALIGEAVALRESLVASQPASPMHRERLKIARAVRHAITASASPSD